MSQPYVTFVTYFRNDGYTSDFAMRVRRAVGCLVGQLEHYQVDSEVILVEWNPPPNRPLIIDAMCDGPQDGHVNVRGIVVDHRYHRSFQGAEERGMHPAEAANVGLRRATGQFVSPKAADTYLSDATIAEIARRRLDPTAMYRCDRFDVLLATADLEALSDTALLARLESLDGARHSRLRQPASWRIRDLHTNACGDFILMKREMWQEVRGYPYDPSVLSLDCDSLVMHAAAALGIREICLPTACRVIKGTHGHLFPNRTTPVWSPWQRRLDGFLAHVGMEELKALCRMTLDYPKRNVRGVDSVVGPSIERNFALPARRWAHGTRPVATQPTNWGLADEPLEERILCQAHWAKSGDAAAA